MVEAKWGKGEVIPGTMNSLCEYTEVGETTRLSGHCQSWGLGGVWGVKISLENWLGARL